MATSKPTIVILPGGYHSPSHYQELIEQLHRANYSTRSSVLPTVNAQNPFAADPATDVAFIREKLLVPVFEAGEDVLLVMHSYSGIPGSVVAKGWSKSERRARGQTGGILGLVFIASVPLHEGESIFTKADGHSVSLAAFDQEAGTSTIPDPIPAFYHDVPEPRASQAAAALLPHSLQVFTWKSTPPAWADPVYAGRRVYIRCMQDFAAPLAWQDNMLEETGVDWDIRDMESSHSPFLSRPEELAAIVVGLAEDLREKSN